MRRLVLVLTLFSLTAPLVSDELDSYSEDTNELYRTGAGSEDGAFSAISTSMISTGVGLSLGIAILASVLHQSGSAHAHSTSD